MDELQKFIADARRKKIDDKLIYELMLEEGWSKSEIKRAFLGKDTSVPAKPKSSDARDYPVESSTDSRNDTVISILQHVFLWVFGIVFIVFIFQVIQAPLTQSADSPSSASKTVISFSLALAVAAVVYGGFYVRYLQNLKTQARSHTNRLWSIATIVATGVTFVISSIGLINVLIWQGGVFHGVAYLLVTVLAVTAALNYGLITFNWPRFINYQLFATKIYPIVLVILAVIAVVASNYAESTIERDLNTQRNLVEASKQVQVAIITNDKLPSSISQAGVIYNKINSHRYQLCADFTERSRYLNQSSFYSQQPSPSPDNSEIYSENGQISAYGVQTDGRAGRHCFRVNVTSLSEDGQMLKDKKI